MDDKIILLLDSLISNSKYIMVSILYLNLNFNFIIMIECVIELFDLELLCIKDF